MLVTKNMDVQKKQPVVSATEFVSKLKSRVWDEIMKLDGSVPAAHPSLFPHVHFAHRSFAERILCPDRLINVRHPSSRVVRAAVVFVVSREICVQPIDNSPSFWTNVSEVQPDRLVDTDLDECDDEDISSKTTLSVKDYFLAQKSPVELFEKGQYLEIQDRLNVRFVHIAKVLKNRFGLLDLHFGNQVEHIYMTSGRIHEIGWAKKKRFLYAPCAESLVEKASKNAVSKEAFKFSTLQEHNFQVGMMLEVLDTSNGGTMYPGYVSEVLDAYYFLVRVSKTVSGPIREILCTRSYPFIFPAAWSVRNKLRISAPEDFGPEEFTWDSYKKKCGLENGCAPEYLFALPDVCNKMFEKGRNVEVMDPHGIEKFYPAKVIRTVRHIVWVQSYHYANILPPAVFSTTEGALFPCGFAEAVGANLYAPNSFKTIACSSATMTSVSTSRLPPAFLRTRKRFLPAVWLKRNMWLPTIFVRKSCFCGPHIDPAKLRYKPDKYYPGPMSHILRLLVVDLVLSAYKPHEFSKVISSGANSVLPQMLINVRLPGKRIRFRMDVCESGAEFIGWLRQLCRMIDACPYLYGLTSLDDDNMPCHLLKTTPSMRFDRHMCTLASNLSTNKELRRMRFFEGPSKKCRKTERRIVNSGDDRIHFPNPVIVDDMDYKELTGSDEGEEEQVISEGAEDELPISDQVEYEIMIDEGTEEETVDEGAEEETVSEGDEEETAEEEVTIDEEADEEMGDSHSCSTDESSEDISSDTESESSICDMDPYLTNPKQWSVKQVARFIADTDISFMREIIMHEEIDGEAFMLLTLAICVDGLGLKFSQAAKVISVVEHLKLVYKHVWKNGSGDI